jgi:hypothetical protein
VTKNNNDIKVINKIIAGGRLLKEHNAKSETARGFY